MPHAYDERGIPESIMSKKVFNVIPFRRDDCVLFIRASPQARNIDIPPPTGCKMKNRGPAVTDCGFNRSLQQIDEIVERVFRSRAFSWGALQRVLADRSSDHVRLSEALQAAPGEMLAAACQMGLEGLIGKRKSSLYMGRRSSDWIKLKCGLRQEFVVGGHTEPGGARTGIEGRWKTGRVTDDDIRVAK